MRPSVRSSLVILAGVVSLALPASRAWSDAGAAATGGSCPEVQCVQSHDGSFCLCRAGADVCSGEHAVARCEAPQRQTCCVSPAGFCYCSTEAQCTFPEDRPTDRCDTALTASPAARCSIGS